MQTRTQLISNTKKRIKFYNGNRIFRFESLAQLERTLTIVSEVSSSNPNITNKWLMWQWLFRNLEKKNSKKKKEFSHDLINKLMKSSNNVRIMSLAVPHKGNTNHKKDYYSQRLRSLDVPLLRRRGNTKKGSANRKWRSPSRRETCLLSWRESSVSPACHQLIKREYRWTSSQLSLIGYWGLWGRRGGQWLVLAKALWSCGQKWKLSELLSLRLFKGPIKSILRAR